MHADAARSADADSESRHSTAGTLSRVFVHHPSFRSCKSLPPNAFAIPATFGLSGHRSLSTLSYAPDAQPSQVVVGERSRRLRDALLGPDSLPQTTEWHRSVAEKTRIRADSERHLYGAYDERSR